MWPLKRLRLRPTSFKLVVAPLERKLLLGPLPVDDLELFLEEVHSLAQGGESEPVSGVLALVPPGAEP